MSEKINPDDVIKWAAIAGGAFLLLKLLKPLNTILSIPEAIISAPGKILDTLKNSAANPPKPQPPAVPTTTPGLSTQDLTKITDRRMIAAVDGADLRKLPSSSASIIQQFARNKFIGYVYSAVNEKLSTGDKTWIAVSNAPGGVVIGYIPLRVVLFDSITIPRVLKNDQLNSGSIGYIPRVSFSYVN